MKSIHPTPTCLCTTSTKRIRHTLPEFFGPSVCYASRLVDRYGNFVDGRTTVPATGGAVHQHTREAYHLSSYIATPEH